MSDKEYCICKKPDLEVSTTMKYMYCEKCKKKIKPLEKIKKKIKVKSKKELLYDLKIEWFKKNDKYGIKLKSKKDKVVMLTLITLAKEFLINDMFNVKKKK